MNKMHFFTATAVTIIILLIAVIPAVPQKGKYTYVGMKECRKCHESDAIGNQYRAWESSPHSKAWRNLRTEKAKIIGAKIGVANPSEDTACLKCHTTGGGKNQVTASEAVGCEACHGPASGYGDISNHAAYGDKEKDYARAVSYGMYKILNIEGIKLREKMCRRCHVTHRPCAPEDPDEKKRQELALSVIADFVFKHPLK
ncbi:MAG: multiheme c-type cytochrome [Spirochaetota bacterium]